MTVGPCIAPPGNKKPHVDFDVEKDEGCKGENSQEHSSCHIHVVLDVHGVIPATKLGFVSFSNEMNSFVHEYQKPNKEKAAHILAQSLNASKLGLEIVFTFGIYCS